MHNDGNASFKNGEVFETLYRRFEVQRDSSNHSGSSKGPWCQVASESSNCSLAKRRNAETHIEDGKKVPAPEDVFEKRAHKLEGEVFSAQGFTSKGAVSLGAMHGWQGSCWCSSIWSRAIKDGDKFATLSPGVFHNMRGTFLQAAALFAIARRTRKRKYRTHANKLAYRIKGWTARRGNSNVRHYHMALMAEQAALRKKYDLAEEYCKNSIPLAARTGHMHDAALINERYAEFLHEELSAWRSNSVLRGMGSLRESGDFEERTKTLSLCLVSKKPVGLRGSLRLL